MKQSSGNVALKTLNWVKKSRLLILYNSMYFFATYSELYGRHERDARASGEKIIEIVQSFKNFDIIDTGSYRKRKITILEKDYNLNEEPNKINNNIAETDTVLRLKGMEKTCVVWSTQIKIEHEDEINNFVYTILTRTSGLLIIAIYNSIDSNYANILQQFRQDRILIWDDSTKNFMNDNFQVLA